MAGDPRRKISVTLLKVDSTDCFVDCPVSGTQDMPLK